MSEAVANLLRSKDIPFTSSGKDYVIKCLNPKHEDSNPSCRVDKLSGITHCFSCGWKRNIFKHFGVFEQNIPSIKIAKLKEKLDDLRNAMIEVEFPEGMTPYNLPFRGLSLQTLKHFEAFYTTRLDILVDRVVFPIRDITGKIAAFIARHVHSNANPRYVVYPSGRPLPCFPSKLDEPIKSIVLVEGIIDMLNLYDKGIRNAVCVFGTNTISDDNASSKLLPYKAQGVEKVFILFDGDDPGRQAAKKLKPIIEAQGFVVEIIHMEDDTDPGELGKDDVLSIKEYTK
jgi:DNA primase